MQTKIGTILDSDIINMARKKALLEHTTLNRIFEKALREYFTRHRVEKKISKVEMSYGALALTKKTVKAIEQEDIYESK